MPNTTYPEHEKLRYIADKSQVCGEFLDWLRGEGIQLAEWETTKGRIWDTSELVLCYRDTQDLLAKFFGIDRNRLEDEKTRMLDELRRMNQSKETSE